MNKHLESSHVTTGDLATPQGQQSGRSGNLAGAVTGAEARHERRDGAGFTLIEILIAIVLVGVLSAVVVVGISSLTEEGSSAACAASLDAAKTGSVAYFAANGTYPTSLLEMTSSSPAMLDLPTGVEVNAAAVGANPPGTIATGQGWVLTLTSGTGSKSPTFSCANEGATASATGTEACPGTFAGWVGEYYSNRNLSGTPTVCRDDDAIAFDWAYDGPAPGVPNNMFSVRWTRTVDFSAKTYNFQAGSDDGVRVFIDGTMLIDSWHDRSHGTSSASRALTAGPHVVVFEFYENGGVASADLSWS